MQINHRFRELSHPRQFKVALISQFIAVYLCGFAVAEPPRYQPEVDKTYTYAIEVFVKPTRSKERPQRYRTCVYFRVNSADHEIWQANYDCLWVSKPTVFAIPKVPDIDPMTREFFSSGVIPSAESMRASAELRHKLMVESMRDAENFQRSLLGLTTNATGTVRVKSNGECVESTGVTRMPLLPSAVWEVPLMRLPESESQTSYSSKTANGVQIVRAGVKLQSEYSVIQAYTPVGTKKPNLFVADRKLEFAGGATADQTLRATGNGQSEFSLTEHMPASGFLETDTLGLAYNGAFDEYSIRITFQRVNSWQRELFAADLIPNAEAFDKKNMQQMNDAQMRELLSLLNTSKKNSSIGLYNSSTRFAPPPRDSTLFITFKQELDRLANSPAAQADRKPTDLQIQLQKTIDRWNKLYRIAGELEREWSDASGSFKITARMLTRTATEVRLARADNGKTISVPIDRLCQDDRDFIATFATQTTTSP